MFGTSHYVSIPNIFDYNLPNEGWNIQYGLIFMLLLTGDVFISSTRLKFKQSVSSKHAGVKCTVHPECKNTSIWL